MPDYFVQHPAGLSSLIVEALKQGVPDALVTYSDDSALAFTSALPSDRVSRLPFVKNAFAVLAVTPRRDVASGIAALAKSLRSVEFPAALQRQPFRTMAHVDGEGHLHRLRHLAGAGRRELGPSTDTLTCVIRTS